MLQSLSVALLATILIEYVVLILLRERRRRVLWASVGMNILTNVPLNLYLTLVDGSMLSVTIGELLVLLVETLCYYCVTKRLALSFVYSFLCNAISFFTGFLFQLLAVLWL